MLQQFPYRLQDSVRSYHCIDVRSQEPIEEGLKDGKIKDGNVVVMTAAGIGWSWNAITIKWGTWKDE